MPFTGTIYSTRSFVSKKGNPTKFATVMLENGQLCDIMVPAEVDFTKGDICIFDIQPAYDHTARVVYIEHAQ